MGEVTPTAKVGERLSIAEVGDRYVADLQRKGRKPETVRAAEVAVRVHFAPFFGDRAMDTITQEDVERLTMHMQASGGRGRRPLAPKSVRNYLGNLSALFTFAQRKKLATHNPVSLVELPQAQENADIRFLTPQEVRTLVAAVPVGPYAEIDRTLFLTAAMTGLRIGELRALRWQDIDWTAARVRVRQNYVRGQYGTPKTKRSTRSVPLADEVAGALDRLHKATMPANDKALVFPDPVTGEPLSDNDIRDRFAVALAAAGLPKHTPHDLRHTFGTRMAAAGVPMRTLQEWLGHRDIATTQIYADYAPSHEEASMVERAFAADPDPLAPGTNSGTNLSESKGT